MAKRTQILSNETINSKGYIVLNDGIIWDRYKNNPILMLEHEDTKEPIGRVENIRFENGNWVGELKFAPTEEGKRKEKLYDEGYYNAVSICGAVQFADNNGMKYAVKFEVWEISLVAIPSNPDAVGTPINKEGLNIIFNSNFGEQYIEKLSANAQSLINKYEQKNICMEKEKKIEDSVNENLNTESKNLSEKEKVIDNDSIQSLNAEKDKPLSEKTFINTIKSLFVNKNLEENQKTNEELHAVSTDISNNITEKIVDTVNENEKLSINPNASIYHEKVTINDPMNEFNSVSEFLSSKEGKHKMKVIAKLGAMTANEIEKTFKTSDVKFYIPEVASLMAADKKYSNFLSKMTFDINYANGRKDVESMPQMLQRLSSGENTIDFITNSPDLARLTWLPMFMRQLLPDNSFADRCQRVSGESRVGMIWVNSAIKPAVYVGDRAPLNTSNYLYDDTPVGLIEKVFSLQPIEWQTANSDVLVYDDRSWGMSEAMRILAVKMHNYYLQKFAEAASVKVPMTGTTTFSASNAFPSNASAAGTLNAIRLFDLVSMETAFTNQNFALDKGECVAVMDAIYMEQLKNDPLITSILSAYAGERTPRYLTYSSFSMQPRSITTLYDTSSSKVVDPELYLDGKVSSNGTIPAYTPPVLNATAYGVVLCFIPGECIIALGNVNTHMVENPNDYAWKFSMDVRTGAGAARANGAGIGLIIPKVSSTGD